jgi:hypothetical protein
MWLILLVVILLSCCVVDHYISIMLLLLRFTLVEACVVECSCSNMKGGCLVSS